MAVAETLERSEGCAGALRSGHRPGGAVPSGSARVGGRALYARGLSPELIGILSVGAALGGSVLMLQVRMDKLSAGVRRIGERMARIEGLLEGAGLFRPHEIAA